MPSWVTHFPGMEMMQEAAEQDIPIVQKNVVGESKNGLIVNKNDVTGASS